MHREEVPGDFSSSLKIWANVVAPVLSYNAINLECS